jgi:hypothetical protein
MNEVGKATGPKNSPTLQVIMRQEVARRVVLVFSPCMSLHFDRDARRPRQGFYNCMFIGMLDIQ